MTSDLTILTAALIGAVMLFFLSIGPLVTGVVENFEIGGFNLQVETGGAKFLDAQGREVVR